MPDIFGGEEWIEGLGFNLRRHADTGVGDRQHHVLARQHLDLRRGVALIEMHVCGFDSELAALGHGVARVDGEIENCDFQLVRIGVGAPEPACQDRFDGDLFAQCPPQQIGHAGDETTNIQGFRLEWLLARERQQSLRQRFGAPRAAHCIVGRSLAAVDIQPLFSQVSLQRFEIADDDGQEIVEVMGNAARELADAFHLL